MKKINTRTARVGRNAAVVVGSSLCLASTAFAGSGGGNGGMSPLMMLFLAFVGVFVLMQLVPAFVIFGSLVSAVFKKSKKAAEAHSAK